AGAEVRGRRLHRLLNELDYVARIEDLQRFTREVVLPPELLALPDLRAALAKGAADVVFGWLYERRGVGWEAVENRLREAGRRVATPNPVEWTSEAVRAIARLGEALQEPREQLAAPLTGRVEPEVRVTLPKGVNPAALGQHVRNGLVLQFRA